MLFLNGRTRNPAVSGMSMRDRSYTHKMGHSFIVGSCLSIVIGLILVIIGVISEIKKTTFIGVGIISLGVGCFITTLVCLYGKLDICYNNWAYRSRVLPINPETPRSTPIGGMSNSPFAELSATAQKQQSPAAKETQAPVTAISDVEIRKVIIAPSIQLVPTADPNNVT